MTLRNLASEPPEMPAAKRLFLSAVSSEFAPHRALLSKYLKRPNLDVAVQEDFLVTGGSTLEKIDAYIQSCDAVVHIIGKAAGAVPEEPAVAALLAKHEDLGTSLPPLAEHLRNAQPGFSYTQWEAYLAIYHRRHVYIYRPSDFEKEALEVPRDARFVLRSSEAQSQREHYQRICDLGRDRGWFSSEESLSSAVLRDLVEILQELEPAVDVGARNRRWIRRVLLFVCATGVLFWIVRTGLPYYPSPFAAAGVTALFLTLAVDLMILGWRLWKGRV